MLIFGKCLAGGFFLFAEIVSDSSSSLSSLFLIVDLFLCGSMWLVFLLAVVCSGLVLGSSCRSSIASINGNNKRIHQMNGYITSIYYNCHPRTVLQSEDICASFQPFECCL
jgi:hypothetical protein